MKKRFQNIFTRVRKKNGLPVLICAVALTFTAGTLVSCGIIDGGADGKLGVVGMRAGGDDAEAKSRDETGVKPRRIQSFTAEDVTVVPKVKQYDFASAKEIGAVQKMQGVLPGADEGIWYVIRIDGVEYYYGSYGLEDAKEADCFGYAIVSDGYALQNGISVGMRMEEVLEKYPNMAVIDFEGNALDAGVTGYQGWNGAAYPRSYAGMDAEYSYDGGDYEWSDQFDFVMLADIDFETKDELPVYAALLVKDHVVAAITFFHPTAG